MTDRRKCIGTGGDTSCLPLGDGLSWLVKEWTEIVELGGEKIHE
jgi:hypothetical protein